jgi:transcriptional regulator with XRE-family HTH domain
VAKAKGKTTDAVEILRRRFVEGNPEMAALVQQERDNADVAQKIYHLRTKAGLTQQQLADRVGTTASVICRLEDADYEGHSLSMLRRVAVALGSRIEVRFVPVKGLVPRKVTETGNVAGSRQTVRKAGPVRKAKHASAPVEAKK